MAPTTTSCATAADPRNTATNPRRPAKARRPTPRVRRSRARNWRGTASDRCSRARVRCAHIWAPALIASRRRRAQRGAITAEIAVTLPVLLTLLFLGTWLIGVVITNIQCIDAARDVARAVARGESPETAQELGRRTAPTNATISITRIGPDIQVTVTATPHHKIPLLSALPPPPIRAQATLQSEPTTQAPSP
ncbi:TadE family type IV pilus minor pilin [Kribbella sp. NPDC023972]|uniref:TadE family type IV pilus minor pilin n=1 Tax=Kribbella sp. NPDC023972 TaxID=3154795 RepID=UPI0033C61D64